MIFLHHFILFVLFKRKFFRQILKVIQICFLKLIPLPGVDFMTIYFYNFFFNYFLSERELFILSLLNNFNNILKLFSCKVDIVLRLFFGHFICWFALLIIFFILFSSTGQIFLLFLCYDRNFYLWLICEVEWYSRGIVGKVLKIFSCPLLIAQFI